VLAALPVMQEMLGRQEMVVQVEPEALVGKHIRRLSKDQEGLEAMEPEVAVLVAPDLFQTLLAWAAAALEILILDQAVV